MFKKAIRRSSYVLYLQSYRTQHQEQTKQRKYTIVLIFEEKRGERGKLSVHIQQYKKIISVTWNNILHPWSLKSNEISLF